MTKQQLALLSELPTPPSDGKRIKGGRLTTAYNLAQLGYARMVGRQVVGGYFVITPAGQAVLETLDAKTTRLYKDAAAIIRTTLTAELTLTEAERRTHIAERLEAL
jgi:hypothetical protein